MKDPYIVAEIGSNCFKYNCPVSNLECAINQIEAAHSSGADAVKFQLFTSAEIWGPGCEEKSFAQVQDKYALPREWLSDLSTKCLKHGIDFLCSAFSIKGFRAVSPFVKMHKLASPEMRADDIRLHLAAQRKPVIYSLGCPPVGGLTLSTFNVGANDIMLECVSDYPADPCHYDLIQTRHLADMVRCRWGISDHTETRWLAVYARSLGASVFEKHVDFLPDGSVTPDTNVSCTQGEFRRYVSEIRNQKIVDHDRLKKGPAGRFGRRRRSGGWFRPWPEGEK